VCAVSIIKLDETQEMQLLDEKKKEKEMEGGDENEWRVVEISGRAMVAGNLCDTF
jgi:hypothetical protein